MTDILRNAGSASVLFIGVNLISMLFKKNNPSCDVSGDTFAYSILFCALAYLLMMWATYRETGAYEMFNPLHLKYSFYGTLIFFLLSSKESYNLVAKVVESTVDTRSCPTFTGIGLHAVIFFGLTCLVMLFPMDSVAEHMTSSKPPVCSTLRSKAACDKRTDCTMFNGQCAPVCSQLGKSKCGRVAGRPDCEMKANGTCGKKSSAPLPPPPPPLCKSLSKAACGERKDCTILNGNCAPACSDLDKTTCGKRTADCMFANDKCQKKCDGMDMNNCSKSNACTWDSDYGCVKQCSSITDKKECPSPRCMLSETGGCLNPCESNDTQEKCSKVSGMCTWNDEMGCVKKCNKLTKTQCGDRQDCEVSPCGTCQDKDVMQCESITDMEGCMNESSLCQWDKTANDGEGMCKKACGTYSCEKACSTNSSCSWVDGRCQDNDTAYNPDPFASPKIM